MLPRITTFILTAVALASCSSSNNDSDKPQRLAAYESMRVESNGSVEGIWLLAESGYGMELERNGENAAEIKTAIEGFRTILVTLSDTGNTIKIEHCNQEDYYTQSGENTYSAPVDNAEEHEYYTLLPNGSIEYRDAGTRHETNENRDNTYDLEYEIDGKGFKISNTTDFSQIRFDQSITVNTFTNLNHQQVYSNAAFIVSCIDQRHIQHDFNESIQSGADKIRHIGSHTLDSVSTLAASESDENLRLAYSEGFSDRTKTTNDANPEQEFVLSKNMSITPQSAYGGRFNSSETGEAAQNNRIIKPRTIKDRVTYSRDPLVIDVTLDISF
ncbi:Uncharacterised protein [BD1-7 clade bacterium]|uniref:Uncharacterized protein n=1 Tax=BD1-7 clade bacterium TaxID=2029982 RepID=A0A5S9P7T5_9GAMM|nr:Uncharacterised protein [BD1-7 clade bacterium]CAA0099563.1 Uncharacterised protein [BD1-7 clade bacterium]